MSLGPIPDDVARFDEEFTAIFAKANEKVPAAIAESSYPRTLMAAVALLAGGDSIKSGVLSLCEDGQIYGSSILYRSMIEHFLRFEYIFLEWAETQSDDPADEFCKFVKIAEALEIGNAYKTMARLGGYEPIEQTPLDLLKEIGIADDNLSRRELDRITQKWKYKQILASIADRFHGTGKPEVNMFGKLALSYAELSSYVHGGLDAAEEAGKVLTEENDYGLVREQAQWSCILSASMRTHFCLILGQDSKEFLDQYSKLMGCLQDYLKEGDI